VSWCPGCSSTNAGLDTRDAGLDTWDGCGAASGDILDAADDKFGLSVASNLSVLYKFDDDDDRNDHFDSPG
jgi:hypothetical protein